MTGSDAHYFINEIYTKSYISYNYINETNSKYTDYSS